MDISDQALAFVDLETTGATATADRITEIGIVLVDGDRIREWACLINPQTRIPEFIENLTGITNAMVATAPRFEDVADEVSALLDGRLFIAHNARFDHAFLKNEFGRIGREFRPTVLCTVRLSRKLFPQFHRHSLDALIERHALAVDGRHRALADARLIHRFWGHVAAHVDADLIGATIQALTARPSLPAHLDPGLPDQLPEGPGVYLFYGENELPLYVGKAKDIRKRVLSHFAADHASAREMDLVAQIRRVLWIETGGEVGALLRESAMIKELQPTHNRQLRRNDELCAWRLAGGGDGPLRPMLVFAGDLEFGRQTDLYGLFKSPKEARDVLRDLAQAHQLCAGALGLETLKPGKPCSAYQLRQCRGICVGREAAGQHDLRLQSALAGLHLRAWPFRGAAILREGDEGHVLDAWCYLGTARSDEEMFALLQDRRRNFDRDTYRILVKHARAMQAIPAVAG